MNDLSSVDSVSKFMALLPGNDVVVTLDESSNRVLVYNSNFKIYVVPPTGPRDVWTIDVHEPESLCMYGATLEDTLKKFRKYVSVTVIN